jgi:hypothetical protein
MGSRFVVSDVHGFREDFERALDEAGFGGDDELWILGDLLDRGPDGIGVVERVRALQEEMPGQVQVLMGNHEILALGRYRFPSSKFDDSWQVNGGLHRDQEGLGEHVDWLASLPLMAQADDLLLMHSDTTEYLAWGESVDDVNDTVRTTLSDASDLEGHWDVWARLTTRYDFTGDDGERTAQAMLATYGGRAIVHGHSIIGTLLGVPSHEVTSPVLYAEGLVLAIDGGRYDGGPLFVVEVG